MCSCVSDHGDVGIRTIHYGIESYGGRDGDSGWNLDFKVGKRGSVLVKAINRLGEGNRSVGQMLVRGLMFLVGKGDTVSFWEDLWLGESKLKNSFLRLFGLVLDENSIVNQEFEVLGGQLYC